MSAIATIPTVSEYRELVLAAGVADNLYGLLIHGSYLYALSSGNPCKIIKVNKTDLTYTVASFPNDGSHIEIGGFVSAPSTNKLYASFRSVITEINPDTLAMADIANTWIAAEGAVIAGPRAFATDNTSLYALFRVDTDFKLAKYALSDLTIDPVSLTLANYAQPLYAGLLYHSGSLYFTSTVTNPPRLIKADAVAMTLTSATNFPAGTAHSAGDDYLDALAGSIYATFEDTPGKIWKFDESLNVSVGFLNVSAEHEALQSDGAYIWDLLENGQAIRIAPDGDERIYQLNSGEGYITEIAGDGQYLYASWLQPGSKIARYKIGSSGGSLQWVQTVTTGLPDYTNSVACDSIGNVIAGGSQQSNGAAWLNKYTPAGGVFWSKGAIVAGATVGVAVDSSDNVYACGWSQGTGTTGSANVFVHKYLANGDTAWQKLFTGPSDEKGYGIVIDPSGNVIICGNFDASLDIGGTVLNSAGGYDMFVAKLSAADGSTIWAKRFGGTTDPGVDVASAVACDPSGNIYIAGQFDISIDFGNGTGTLTGTGSEGFLVKLNSSGIAQWSKRFGGTLNDASYGVATFSNGDVVVTGGWRNTTDFGFGNVTASGQHDAFIAKYSTAGTPIWVKTFGGSMGLSDYAYGAAVDGDDNLIVCGAASGDVDFGSGAVAMNGLDCWVVKCRSNGDLVWVKTFGNATFPDRCLAVAVDPSGNAIAGGFFYGEVDFGGEIRHYPNAGGDAFIAKYSA